MINKIFINYVKSLWNGFVKRFLIQKLTQKQLIGLKGESIAASFLCKKGYQIVRKNWRYKNLEIDIICKNKDTLIFVEVRSRVQEKLITIYRSITKKKRKTLSLAMKAYLRNLTIRPKSFRFDLVLISNPYAECPDIKHFQNIELNY